MANQRIPDHLRTRLVAAVNGCEVVDLDRLSGYLEILLEEGEEVAEAHFPDIAEHLQSDCNSCVETIGKFGL